ncbi:hypothetical protein [Pseudomonas sp. Ant30-3]|uniref:hypothetical protein n=1 Tax=Pseudomonas sp. Ant30-3 TaxID=1488328 RepID=UPI0015A718B9|nr:hypothetical protein [Pseudomonas sp. Ant30-3]
MKNLWLATLVASIVSVSFWLAVSWLAEVDEPWDAGAYWTVIYPAALALTLMLGLLFSKHRWLSGPVVMFGQVPCVMMNAEAGPLLAVGLLYALLLSIPAVLLSWAARPLYRRLVAN